MKWARRVALLLHDQLYRSLQLGLDDSVCAYFKRLIDIPPGETTLVYVLFAHTGYYIGKANDFRQDGTRLGFCSRGCEHLRALLRPRTREGGCPRYVLLRKALGSVGLVPVNRVATELRAESIESTLIYMLMPPCNRADKLEEMRRLK